MSEPGWKTLLGLEKDFEYMQRVVGPRANVMALNEVRKKIRTDVTNAIWKEARYLPLVDDKGRKIRGKKISTKIKRALIYKRVYTSKATINGPHSLISGYFKEIPLSELGHRKVKNAPGITELKGTINYRKTTGNRAKVQKSSLSGLTLGGTFLLGAFIQAVRSGRVMVFRKDHQGGKGPIKTWQPGHTGWGYKKGTPSGSVPPRMPYSVLKTELKPAFDKHFLPTVEKTMADKFEIEYAKAFQTASNRLMK